MNLDLTIESRSLAVEIDDVIVGLYTVRLNLPEGVAPHEAISHHLSEVAGPWILDEEHMRKRVLRRLILEIADPALVIRYLMADK